MPPNKRWVKKGQKKTKGWKRTGRTRKVNTRKITKISIFPIGDQRTIPDRLSVVLNCQFVFTSPIAVGTGGNMAYYNISGNWLIDPFVTGSGLASFNSYSAAIGGAGGGFNGTLNPGYVSTADPLFYNAFVPNMYTKYYVKSSSIEVNATISNSLDEGDIVILPVPFNQTQTTVFSNASTSRYAKIAQIGGNAFGINQTSNTCKNYMSTATLKGIKASDDLMVLQEDLVGDSTTNPPSCWQWQVGYQRRLGGSSTTGQLTFRTKMKYFVTFFQPAKQAS